MQVSGTWQTRVNIAQATTQEVGQLSFAMDAG